MPGGKNDRRPLVRETGIRQCPDVGDTGDAGIHDAVAGGLGIGKASHRHRTSVRDRGSCRSEEGSTATRHRVTIDPSQILLRVQLEVQTL